MEREAKGLMWQMQRMIQVPQCLLPLGLVLDQLLDVLSAVGDGLEVGEFETR
jgi:hypothetical protein